jgi:DNA repair exonuclease SbcCD ATPase subunit
MKLEQLILENFMGWAKLNIDLAQYNGILAVMGSIESDLAHSNGTGKSSLIAGINYSLYGTSVSKNLDGMIHQVGGVPVESGYKVVLRFSHNGAKYEITRRKKPGAAQKTAFKDLTNDKPMVGTPEEFLRMPEVVWQNTVYSAQRNLSAFVDKLPSARKDILTEIFGMNNYLVLETKARQLAAKSETEMGNAAHTFMRETEELNQLTGTQEEVDQAAAKITEYEATEASVAAEQTEAAILINSLTEKISAADSIAAEIREAANQVDNINRRQANIKFKHADYLHQVEQKVMSLEYTMETVPDPVVITNIQEAIKVAEAVRPAIDELIKQRQAVSNQIATAKAAVKRAQQDVAAYTTQINDLPTDKCPLCGNVMTAEHLAKHKGDLQAQADQYALVITTQQDLINKLSINLQNIEGEIAGLTPTANSIASLSRSLIAEQDKKTAYDNAAQKLQALAGEKERVIADYVVAEADLSAALVIAQGSLQIKRTSMPVVDDIAQQRADLSRLNLALQDKRQVLHSQLAQIRDERARAQANIERKNKLAVALQELAVQVNTLTMQHNTHVELIRAFGPAGIPTLILENCLSELQQYLDYYMDILSDGKIHVSFQTVKTNTTTAKTSETLNIMVSDINGERDIALYSGGETVRIYLAIRLALAKLLYLKSGQKLGLLIIDEIADLDEAGLAAFVELLKKIQGEFEQVILVSHLPELKSAFDNALVLSRDLEGNYIPV